MLSAEGAEVLGVLTDFNLLDLLPQAGTISGAVLADNPDLLCTLGHRIYRTNKLHANVQERFRIFNAMQQPVDCRTILNKSWWQ